MRFDKMPQLTAEESTFEINTLTARVKELEEALEKIETLQHGQVWKAKQIARKALAKEEA